MTSSRYKSWYARRTVFALLLFIATGASQADSPSQLLQQLNEFPHARNVQMVEQDVLDYEIGLGAIQKTGGAWKFKHSERFSGTLTAYTWQIIDGFTSQEVMDGLVGKVDLSEGAQLLFSCEGRACGRGVQWANRVFHQPVLYGREDMQRYRAYSIGGSPRNLLLIYASARTADRQYLHAQVLEITP